MRYEFYKISLLSNPEYTYIGHTTNFTKRKYRHKVSLNDKTKINIPLYKTINENSISILLSEKKQIIRSTTVSGCHFPLLQFFLNALKYTTLKLKTTLKINKYYPQT